MSIRGRRRALVSALAAVLMSATLASCGGTGSNSTGNATLNLALTDAPVDSASKVVVEFTGVQLQPTGGGSPISFTFPSPQQIDLLQEQNGNAATLLNGVSIPAGQYDWIRLMLNVGAQNVATDSYIEINGAQYPIMIPSGSQTGLKLVQGFTMTANQVANFTIDFVLEQAVTAPNGQMVNGVQAYMLRPALRLIDNVQAGTIAGTVQQSTLQNLSPSCFDGTGAVTAHVYIFSGSGATLTDIQIDSTTGLPPANHVNPVVTPAVTASAGQYSYSQPLLLAGPYTVALACGSDDPNAADTLAFTPAAGTAATVTANTTTMINF